ncbi:hypothetical protein TWF694_007454 [Orbilia ellipsospora]|uniref:DUF2423 domain-containing protein n=1 Tax=Orbilia ellipsospora TaxID=2528407 RepID=A0AAV9XJA3_9PEZI
MAKSARASTKKTARSRIRSTVYAPVEQARLERLSARLMASIAQSSTPRTTSADHMDEDDLVDATTRQEQHTEDQAFKAAQQDSNTSTNMDIDESSTSRKASSANSKATSHKVSKNRKAKSKSIVFNTRKTGAKKAKASKGRK